MTGWCHARGSLHRSQPRIDPAAGCARACHHLWRHGCDQHGAWRDGDDRRLCDRAVGHLARHQHLRRYPAGLHRDRAAWPADRAGGGAAALWPAARYAARDLGHRDPDPAGGAAGVRPVVLRHPCPGTGAGAAECQRARLPAGDVPARRRGHQPLPDLHHSRDRGAGARDLVHHLPHDDGHAGARHHPQSQDGGGLRHRRDAGQRADFCVWFGARGRCRRDDVRLQDGVSRHGNLDGGRRLPCRRDGRRRQPARVGVLRRHPGRDQWTGGGRDQRHSGARGGVRRRDRDHRSQAEGPVRPEGPLKMLSKRRIEWAMYALFVVAIMVAPLIMESFWLNRVAKYLVYGMLGVAVALSWGYAGILNLGQGLFFGAGAYMLAMSLKLASPTSLQQGSDKPVPDFMLWNAEPGAPTELCCINKASFLWLPFQSQWFGVAMGMILPVAIAFVLGTIVFRKRMSGVFVSIITLALVLLVRLVVIDTQPVTNGFNGLTDLGWFNVLGLEFDPYIVPTYYLVAVSLSLVLVCARLLVDTRAGIILQAVRDDQNRARYLGFDVPAYQTFFFAVSAAIAGFAGMLYVIVSEFASPTFMDLTFSITMVVWAAVGGRSSILGACIGAILINLISATVSETQGFAEAWKAIIGLIFVLVVLYLPRGLGGLAHDLVDRIVTRKPNAAARELRVSDTSSQLAE